MSEHFDRVISIGMFEHTDDKNYRGYMRTVFTNLTDDGLFLLHTIGVTGLESGIEAWVSKYIFPNSVLPTAQAISGACADMFVIEDWHNLDSDYIKRSGLGIRMSLSMLP
ncbi:class I SAM-dependent methyltransferase [Desulfopila sp. IMCC35006]|uniref:class I SAM-dependent methyltransferase n=1 Tax=Desulfopila sp. IMCC35006 TaxID=2569542 RepID=UPI001F0F6F93|nr:class I SAM-dependent methyltransferase [Desulfopila sp. IMCC35006]